MEDYEIVELIAQGGYGIVLKALQKSTGQMVAIKQFRDSDSYAQRIAEREISFLKLLHGHPNIIKLLSSFQQQKVPHESVGKVTERSSKRGGTGVHVFMVFELMQQTLLDVLQQSPGGKMDRETVRLIVYQMVKALDHMHSLNAVHRDIKPENMLLQKIQPKSRLRQRGRSSVEYRGNSRLENRDSKQMVDSSSLSSLDSDKDSNIFVLKVCDLGQCRQIHQSTTNPNLTEYVSTRWYRAPELLVGSKIYDKSVDIWALGCMIPELISGSPLFPGNSNLEALAYVIKTLGNNCLTQDMINNFNSNSEFSAYGKIPVIKKLITLEERVPYLMGDDLRFVKACLSVDPAKRPTTKDLLKHSYLSLEEHSILRKFENALLQDSPNHISEESKQSVSSSRSSNKCSNDLGEARDDLSSDQEDDDLNKRSASSVPNQLEAKNQTADQLSNQSIQIEEQLRFPSSSSGAVMMIPEEEQPFCINSDAEAPSLITEEIAAQQVITEEVKVNGSQNDSHQPIMSGYAQSKKSSANSRVTFSKKYRPSSSGGQNQSEHQSNKAVKNINQEQNAIINQSQQRLLGVQKQTSEEYGTETAQNLQANANQNEIDAINTTGQPDKQMLPKPILFLRKQKYEGPQGQLRNNQSTVKDEKMELNNNHPLAENHMLIDGEFQNIRPNQEAVGGARILISGQTGIIQDQQQPTQNPQGFYRNRIDSKQIIGQKRDTQNGGGGFLGSQQRAKRFSEQYGGANPSTSMPHQIYNSGINPIRQQLQDEIMAKKRSENMVSEFNQQQKLVSQQPVFKVQKNKVLFQNLKSGATVSPQLNKMQKTSIAYIPHPREENQVMIQKVTYQNAPNQPMNYHAKKNVQIYSNTTGIPMVVPSQKQVLMATTTSNLMKNAGQMNAQQQRHISQPQAQLYQIDETFGPIDTYAPQVIKAGIQKQQPNTSSHSPGLSGAGMGSQSKKFNVIKQTASLYQQSQIQKNEGMLPSINNKMAAQEFQVFEKTMPQNNYQSTAITAILANTQKHITSKLQLPQIQAAIIQPIKGNMGPTRALPIQKTIQQQDMEQSKASFRKSQSIKRIEALQQRSESRTTNNNHFGQERSSSQMKTHKNIDPESFEGIEDKHNLMRTQQDVLNELTVSKQVGLMSSPETAAMNSKLMSPVLPKSYKEKVIMLNNVANVQVQQTLRINDQQTQINVINNQQQQYNNNTTNTPQKTTIVGHSRNGFSSKKVAGATGNPPSSNLTAVCGGTSSGNTSALLHNNEMTVLGMHQKGMINHQQQVINSYTQYGAGAVYNRVKPPRR